MKYRQYVRKIKNFSHQYCKACIYLFIILFVAIAVPVIINFVLLKNDQETDHTCNILQDYRIRCGYNITSSIKCTEINCCFNEKTQKCYHTLPSKYQYKKDTKGEYIPLLSKSPFGDANTKRIYLSYYPVDSNTFSFTLNDDKPSGKGRREQVEGADLNYGVDIETEEMGLNVTRKGKIKETILTTSYGPTIVSDKFWEWTLDLNTDHLFGLNQLRFKDNKITTVVLYPNANNHGVIPKFMAEHNGKYHGVYIEHEGPLEISVLPSKLIVLRMLSGQKVTVYVYLGPTPREVWLQQKNNNMPQVPPSWVLGVHICR